MDKLIYIQSKYLNDAVNNPNKNIIINDASADTRVNIEKLLYCLKLTEFSNEKYLKYVNEISQLNILKEYALLRKFKYCRITEYTSSLPVISVIIPKTIGLEIIDKLYNDDTICAILYHSRGLNAYNLLYKINCNNFNNNANIGILNNKSKCVTRITLNICCCENCDGQSIEKDDEVVFKNSLHSNIQTSLSKYFNSHDVLCELVLFWGKGFPIKNYSKMHYFMYHEYPKLISDITCDEINKIFFDRIIDIFAPSFNRNFKKYKMTNFKK